MKHKFKSIKLYIFLIQFFLSIFLVLFSYISGSHFIEFQIFITGFYFASNIASKFSRNKQLDYISDDLIENYKQKNY